MFQKKPHTHTHTHTHKQKMFHFMTLSSADTILHSIGGILMKYWVRRINGRVQTGGKWSSTPSVTCHSTTLYTTNSTQTGLETNRSLCGQRQATNHFQLNNAYSYFCNCSRDCVVDLVTRLGAVWPMDRGSISGRLKRFFSSPKCPDRYWGSTSLLVNGCWGTDAADTSI